MDFLNSIWDILSNELIWTYVAAVNFSGFIFGDRIKLMAPVFTVMILAFILGLIFWWTDMSEATNAQYIYSYWASVFFYEAFFRWINWEGLRKGKILKLKK